jgi:serine/threonine protein kinase
MSAKVRYSENLGMPNVKALGPLCASIPMSTELSDNDLAPGVRQGDVLAGKYEVERVLGVGGMGIVVAARHVQLGVRVAVKFLLPAMLDHAEAVARFSLESAAVVRITSEHVPRVIDVGTLESGAPYIVMEFLEGEDLASWLVRRGPLPTEEAVEFVLQACVGVADAHALGIVHRDLKPSNLFCVRRSDGRWLVKVLDFGISKRQEKESDLPFASVTRTGIAMGSPAYASPEQLRSARDVDGRTDIWAMGVILYELLAGTPPFAGEGAADLAIKVATEDPLSLSTWRSDVAPGLEQAIGKCLSKKPEDRYADIAELALALLPFGNKRAADFAERVSAILITAGLTTSVRPTTPLPAPAQPTSAPSGWLGAVRSRRLQVAGALVVAAVATATGLRLRTAVSSTRDTESGRSAEGAKPQTSEGEARPLESASLSPPTSTADRTEIRIKEAPALATHAAPSPLVPGARPAAAPPSATSRTVAPVAQGLGPAAAASPSTAPPGDPFQSWKFKQ